MLRNIMYFDRRSLRHCQDYEEKMKLYETILPKIVFDRHLCFCTSSVSSTFFYLKWIFSYCSFFPTAKPRRVPGG